MLKKAKKYIIIKKQGSDRFPKITTLNNTKRSQLNVPSVFLLIYMYIITQLVKKIKSIFSCNLVKKLFYGGFYNV